MRAHAVVGFLWWCLTHRLARAIGANSMDFNRFSRIIRVAADLHWLTGSRPPGAAPWSMCRAPAPSRPWLCFASCVRWLHFGIFRVSVDGTVVHSPRSLLLRTDAPRSLHHAARFWTGRGFWRAWEELDEALGGHVPHETAWAATRFQYLSEHPEEGRIFDTFMAHYSDDRHSAVAAAYDFSRARLIVDIGGGNGEMLRRVLSRFPGPRGLVFDRADVVAAIRNSARADGRIAVQAGSFFEGVPASADLYLLVYVLPNWSDEDCGRILRRVHDAMEPRIRLLVVETLLEPDPTLGPPEAYLLDIQMMAMFGTAHERTEAEFRDLLGAQASRPCLAPRRSRPFDSPRVHAVRPLRQLSLSLLHSV